MAEVGTAKHKETQVTNSPEVLVIGAGIAGCASAYYLAKAGAKVLVIDKDNVGTHASKYALGLLNPLTGSENPGKNEKLMSESFKIHKELWPVLLEESGIDFQPRTIDHIELFMTEKESEVHSEEMWRWEKTEGFKFQKLTSEDILKMDSRISQNVHSGAFLGGIGIVDSGKLTLAFSEAAKSYGAEFLKLSAVDFVPNGTKGEAITTDQGILHFEKLIVAMGPWSKITSKWFNYPVPITPLKGEIVYFKGTEDPYNIHLELKEGEDHGSCSVITKADGHTWLAATETPSGLDETTTEKARKTLMNTVRTILPDLSESKIVNQTACLRPIAPDLRPIIGKLPEWDNVFMATGAGKKGILISPIIGSSTSDIVLTGNTHLPIEWASPQRFSNIGIPTEQI